MSRWKSTTMVAVVTLTAALLVGPLVTTAAARPLAPETMLAERTNPAVNLITVEYSATVQMRTSAWNATGKRLIRDLASTGRYSTLTDLVEAAFRVAKDDPELYFKGLGRLLTNDYTDGGSGSGFVVDGDGYLVTARHVVTDDGSVKRRFARRGAADFADGEVKGWKKAYADYDLTSGAVNAIEEAMAAYAEAKVKVKMSKPKVAVVLLVPSGDGTQKAKMQPAEVVYTSNPDLDVDIAVLRVRGVSAMPTVSLATQPVAQGAPVHINCFPALPDDSETAVLTPTLTNGRVTSLKPTSGGIQLIQTDAQASPGCSGGAGLDEGGNVIGVLVSGAVDQSGGSLGEFYLMPINVVTEALKSENIPAAVSLTTRTYDDALADFSQDYYGRALERFEQVKSLYPAHPYVDRYISECQAALSRGEGLTPPPEKSEGIFGLGLPVLVGVAGGSAAVVLGGVLFLARRRRGPAAPSIAPAAPSQPWTPVDPWNTGQQSYGPAGPASYNPTGPTSYPPPGPPTYGSMGPQPFDGQQQAYGPNGDQVYRG